MFCGRSFDVVAIKTYIMNTMIDYVEETMKEKFDLVKTIKYSKEEY